MNVLGVKVRNHDTGAALISNDRVVAISEERLARIKYADWMFPARAIAYCLQEMHLTPQDIDLIVIDQEGSREYWPVEKLFVEEADRDLLSVPRKVLNHHMSHAASAFFASPLKESAIFVIDGAGEQFNSNPFAGLVETETIYMGKHISLVEIKKSLHQKEFKKEYSRSVFSATHGLGLFYSSFSRGYLNLGLRNEGKTMGLAAYGSNDAYVRLSAHKWFEEKDGSLVFDKSNPDNPKPYGKAKILSQPARTTESLPDTHYASIAYAIQKVLEDGMLWWAKRVKDLTQSENLCMAGGVALNIDANRKILDSGLFKNIFIQPAASDAGIPLGCALWGYHVALKQPRFFTMRSASLGHHYTEDEVLTALNEYKDQVIVEKCTKEEKATKTAEYLTEGKVIGWFQGGAEYGPRALGNRSILADPRTQEMKDKVNNQVKHREPWRPFGASILLEKTQEWFDLNVESPFMLLTGNVHKDKEALIPAVMHVDHTSRLQTVTQRDNGQYYDLIKAFDQKTNVPMLLNTSFNMAGEPMVETPQDALKTFLATQIDVLVLEDYIVRKK